MMGDHFTTQYNHRKRMLSQVRDLFYWCRHGQWHLHKFLERRTEMVLHHNSYLRLTRYNKEFVDGYMERMQEELDREMEWRVFVPDLGHVNARTDEGRKLMNGHWSECISDLGANFWPGTDKVWYAGNATHDVVAMYEGSPEQYATIVQEYVAKDKERRAKLNAEALEKYARIDQGKTDFIGQFRD